MKGRNASIDIFRIICALMVVAIHTGPLLELGYNWWYFAVQIMPRIAVPFFFCVFGYYYIGSLLKGDFKLGKTMKRLLFTYGLWSIIYYSMDLKNIINGSVSLSGFLANCLRQFLIYGSREHFWFFPALFFSIITATIFAKFGKLSYLAGISIIVYILGLLGCSYYGIGNSLPLITVFVNYSQYDLIRRIVLMALPFFMMGYYLQKINLEKIKNKTCIVKEVIYAAGFLAEIIMVNRMEIQKNIYLTIFLYLLLFNTMVLLLKNPCEQYGKAASVTRDLSNFMYYSHPLFMIWINLGFSCLIGRNATGTELFILTVILSGGIGYVLHKMNHKYLNKLFK